MIRTEIADVARDNSRGLDKDGQTAVGAWIRDLQTDEIGRLGQHGRHHVRQLVERLLDQRPRASASTLTLRETWMPS